MIEEIKKLKSSKIESDRRRALGLLDSYLKSHPSDSEAWYNKACCHDFLGEEKEAEPCYRKTFELGWQKLPLEEQKSFFVGFGSTLRNNFNFDESIQVLSDSVKAFPDYPALKLFLALSHYSKMQDQLVIETLFAACLESASKGLDGYEKAIQWYAEHLKDHP